MEVFKAMVFVGESGKPQYLDAILHEGYWWIVATWLQHPATGHRIPERIIQLDGMTVCFQEVDEDPAYRFLVNNSIPMSVLDGEPQEGYVIAIHPDAVAHTRGPKSTH